MPSRCVRAALVSLAVIAFLWGQSFQRAAAQVPEENRKQVVEALGPPFIVFRDAVLDELKVSDEQREKLMQHIRDRIMETGPFLESLAEAGEEREKKLNEHKKIALEKLAKHLKEVLEPEQLTRLRQVTLQVEGAFALGQDDVRKELKITQDQMMKFAAIVRSCTKSRTAESRHNRGASRKRSDRKSSRFARSKARSLKPFSPTTRESSGKRCLARSLSWVISSSPDRGAQQPEKSFEGAVFW